MAVIMPSNKFLCAYTSLVLFYELRDRSKRNTYASGMETTAVSEVIFSPSPRCPSPCYFSISQVFSLEAISTSSVTADP